MKTLENFWRRVERPVIHDSEQPEPFGISKKDAAKVRLDYLRQRLGDFEDYEAQCKLQIGAAKLSGKRHDEALWVLTHSQIHSMLQDLLFETCGLLIELEPPQNKVKRLLRLA